MSTYCVTEYGVLTGSADLQTEALQRVFDLCREAGGTVVFPRGVYRTGGLRMWSDTTLYLEAGACLVGSDVCEDYPVFAVPENVSLRTDMEMITQYYKDRPWQEYRRAVVSVYGGRNIAVIGEEGSVIDGSSCADPQGEEGYRGPHGLFITNVDGLTLSGYTIRDCGNFMHQVDNCRNITMKNVVCAGGSDGIHLHCCVHTLIEDCVFHTGDDCIAGINIEDLTVRRCEINTSCQAFRVGGSHVLVEDCRIWGPGIFAHRVTLIEPHRGTELVRKKENYLPNTMGRHNLICVYLHFASTNYPAAEPYHDVVFRRVTVDNADRFLCYHADCPPLESGTHLTELTLEDVTCTNMGGASSVSASKEEPLTVRMKNVTASFRENAPADALFDGLDPNTVLLSEA